MALFLAPAYVVLGLIPVTIYLRHLRSARIAGDPRVFINTDRIRRGKTFDVRIEQPFKKPATLESLRIALICDQTSPVRAAKKTVLKSGPYFQTWTDLNTNEQVTPAHPAEARTKFTPPADQPATTPTDALPPSYRWRIAIESKVEGRSPYRADYPINVEG